MRHPDEELKIGILRPWLQHDFVTQIFHLLEHE